MSRHVNTIAGRLSLRAPQRRSLEILDRVVELAPPGKNTVVADALAAIQAEFPSVTDFEREFPSICFALATGVGKTRLMGAFITYLHVAHGIKNFFVMAPNLTIYNKLITDFTPNTPKYVFTGIAEFAVEPPEIITGDTYDKTLIRRDTACVINIFNISKINSEVRGGRSPRIKRLSEYIGESYFEYLSGLPDLVLIMDESHRYRASAGVRAINELKPVIGLELTATPQVEVGPNTVRFKNVIYDYPLGSAIADGFVKDPTVVTRQNFSASEMSPAALDEMKLADGVRLHELTKVELETYARENSRPIVKPFLLVIARDTTHASTLVTLVESEDFFDGRYKGKVIQVDSSRSGAEEEAMVQRLLKVESADEPTEIVVHVNMLKEGWDVTNLYTIVPLRAANARTLIEQSIGRGLRLPYGRRTGVDAVDRLSIVAHDKFQEIVDETRRPGSLIQLKTMEIDPTKLAVGRTTVVVPSNLQAALAPTPSDVGGADGPAPQGFTQRPPLFDDPRDREVAAVVAQIVESYSHRPGSAPNASYLLNEDVQTAIVRETQERWVPSQPLLEGVQPAPDFARIAHQTLSFVLEQTFEIPRILVVPKGEVRSGFHPFKLDLTGLRLQPPDEALWVQYMQSGRAVLIQTGPGGIETDSPESVVVRALVDFPDVSYDDNAEVINELGRQVVEHLRSYLSDDEVRKVLQYHEHTIGEFVHAQMQPHHWLKASGGHEVEVRQGFVPLKTCAYTVYNDEAVRNFKIAPDDRSNMGRYVFGYFERCLYAYQKFDSDSERRLAVILDRDSSRWFRPVKGQFRIDYRFGATNHEYQPDFVAETDVALLMIEVKAANEMDDPEVLAKKAAGEEWCRMASEHATRHRGKPWRYVLIRHDGILENVDLEWLTKQR